MTYVTKLSWDNTFKEKGVIFTMPDINIPKLLNILKKEKKKKLLDLGCGTGRHVIYFAKKGFEVYGIDIGKNAISIAKKLLKKENLKAKLMVGDIFKRLPYPDNYFDAVISVRVLNHGKITWIRKAIKESYRVLNSGGIIFVTVHKHQGKNHIPKDKLYGIKWIAPRTYIILGGPEKGMPHYRFNKQILLREFRRYFKIEDFWIDKNSYYCLRGRKI